MNTGVHISFWISVSIFFFLIYSAEGLLDHMEKKLQIINVGEDVEKREA